MPRFFINTIPGEDTVISGEDGRHIAKSLRMQPGEVITLCDRQGHDYFGEITEISGETVSVHITEMQASKSEPSIKVTLCQGVPKSDKMDLIVQKAVELGVWRIVPTVTSRCISRPDEKSAHKKVQRWQKIAQEAAKQSGRGIIPQVTEFTALKQACRDASGKRVLFYEGGGERIPVVITELDTDITVYIGPEGGFAAEEVQLIQDAGGFAATLGPRILRTETAPLAALAAIMLVTNNL